MVGHSAVGETGERRDTTQRSIDVVFDVLSDQRRRYAIGCLTDQTQAIALADLAEDIAVRENEGSITSIPKQEVQTIRLSLYHNHMSKMVDAGIVEYDRDRNLVRISDTDEQTEQILSLATDREEGQL